MNTCARASLLADAAILELSPADIDTSGRTGFYFPDKAEAFAHLLRVDGQRDPIKVVVHPKKDSPLPWLLVTGKHRTEGARLAGLPVYALEVKGKPEDLKDLESSENKHRRVLNPIEDAKFVAALSASVRDRVARERGELKQQQIAAKARWDRVKAGQQRPEEALRDEVEDAESHLETAYGVEGASWEQTVGNALGLGRAAIYRALRLHRFIIEPFPDYAEQLANHPVVGENAKQLRDIADLRDEGVRRKVIEALLADPELSADEAIPLIMPELAPRGKASAEEKFTGQIVTGWKRLGLPERRRFIESDKFLGLFSTPGLRRLALARLAEEQNDG